MAHKVSYRGEVSSMNEEDIKNSLKFINKCKYCIIGSLSGQNKIHLDILTTQETEGLKELWFISRTSTQKIENLKQKPECELLYTDDDNQITLSGKTELVTDVELKKEMSNIWVEKYIPEGPESDEMILIKFIPETINAMVV